MAGRNAQGQFAKGNPGRPKGSKDRITREFKDLMESILFDDIETTRSRLLALRDSEDASDRKTFWGIASKLMPQKVEGKIEAGLPILSLVQDFKQGAVMEIDANGEDDDDEDPAA